MEHMLEQEDKRSQKKATIVIVDDEESILKELRILLGRLYKVHVFANPEEAEVFVDNNEVDLVISDEMMPEMRGSELLAKIHQKHPDICNIVLSGQAEKDDIVRAVNEGHLFSFLYKPTERQQLLNVIEKGLENRNMKIKLAKQNIQLKQYSENLEKMVEEKTTQLVKAYDRLNMLDAGKMHFLVYLSEEMDSSLDRIQKLAKELLTYFGFAGSDLNLHLSSVDLGELVESAIQKMLSLSEEKDINLELKLEPNMKVMADRDSLLQAVRTLAENAVVFSDTGGTVRISCKQVDGKVRLCISDTGKGIVKENLKKVFMPFVIDKENRNQQGFGLNLPMAKLIVDAHDGDIWAESDGPGKGSTFCFELTASG